MPVIPAAHYHMGGVVIGLDGRSDLSAPAPVQLRYYRDDARELHGRLVGEFAQELERLLARASKLDCAPRPRRVLPFRG